MIAHIVSKWGANYLVYEYTQFDFQSLITEDGQTINRGDRIIGFGRESHKRDSFFMEKPHWMQYEGIWYQDFETKRLPHAIFSVPSWGEDSTVKYRYAFGIVGQPNKVSCFLLQDVKGNGFRDVRIKEIHRL